MIVYIIYDISALFLTISMAFNQGYQIHTTMNTTRVAEVGLVDLDMFWYILMNDYVHYFNHCFVIYMYMTFKHGYLIYVSQQRVWLAVG